MYLLEERVKRVEKRKLLLLLPDLCMFQEQQHKLRPVLWVLMIKLSNDAYGKIAGSGIFWSKRPKRHSP